MATLSENAPVVDDEFDVVGGATAHFTGGNPASVTVTDEDTPPNSYTATATGEAAELTVSFRPTTGKVSIHGADSTP